MRSTNTKDFYRAKSSLALIIKEASAADFKRPIPLAHFVLLLDSFLADQCVNLIYKEQDVLDWAITKGLYKMTAEKLFAHPQKNLFCASV